MPDFECQVSQDVEQHDTEVALLARDPARAETLEAAAKQVLSGVHGRQRETLASRYKISRYDIPVRLADDSALLFNSRTRSLILLSDGEARTYRELAEQSSFSSGQVNDRLLLEALVGGGHVVGAVADELAVVRDSYEATRGTKGSLTLTIAPTMACNFACGYCFQGLNKPTARMKPDVQNAIVDFVKAKKDLKSLNIVWYGGEPLVGKDSIFRLSDLLISYCDKHKISYGAGIVSNAWFLNGEMAAQLYTRRVRWVQVTIDGDRGTHDMMRPLTSGQGTFDRILDNIAEALDQTAISINARVNATSTTSMLCSIASSSAISPNAATSASTSPPSRRRRQRAEAPSKKDSPAWNSIAGCSRSRSARGVSASPPSRRHRAASPECAWQPRIAAMSCRATETCTNAGRRHTIPASGRAASSNQTSSTAA
ncbi:radical SAM protein [Bradyrhizobium sp. Arg62]|uniref:radical SAM protein n=1 Tax=Bradyrhizobium TaxID=374 RepID=UPI001E28803F|nr:MULTISPECIES: radical SAM protein [Bradyrhizobium]MCC8940484.1 radical SAM protein [Bradyrhizobium ivorense]MCC8951504.1 radical SAM protein [Bradyrhizobium brasilense]